MLFKVGLRRDVAWFGGVLRFGLFLCVHIPGSPGEFIYLLHEKEREKRVQEPSPKNQSSTIYRKQIDTRAGAAEVGCRPEITKVPPGEPLGTCDPPDPRGMWPVPGLHPDLVPAGRRSDLFN